MKLKKSQRAVLVKLANGPMALASCTRLGVHQVHFAAGRWLVAQGLASSAWVTSSIAPYEALSITEAGRALPRELEATS